MKQKPELIGIWKDYDIELLLHNPETLIFSIMFTLLLQFDLHRLPKISVIGGMLNLGDQVLLFTSSYRLSIFSFSRIKA